MKMSLRVIAVLSFCIVAGFAQNPALSDQPAVLPEKISEAEIAGEIFSRPDTITSDQPGGLTRDVVTHLSPDNKFVTGMYSAGASRAEINEPYGVDEFMYFIEGGVTLTSADGSVLTIDAGEAVTIPRDWTGVWQTEGYTKIYVIHSPSGDIE